MPQVKQSHFACPVCGQPTCVKRTRKATPTWLVRYRQCPEGHNVRTDERVHETRTSNVRLALHNLAKSAGIDEFASPAIPCSE